MKQEESTIEHISFKLEGEEAERFRRFKKKQYLKNNSEAARKALFERIEQAENEKKQVA